MENPDVGGDVSNTGGRTVVEEAYQKTAGNMELQVQEGTEINDVDYHVPLLHPPAGTTDMVNWIWLHFLLLWNKSKTLQNGTPSRGHIRINRSHVGFVDFSVCLPWKSLRRRMVQLVHPRLLTYLDSHYNACWCWPRCLASCWADCLFGIISNYRSPILPNHCQNHHWSKMKTLLTWQMFTLSKYCGARFELQQPAELDVNVDLTSIIMQQSWILC